MRCCVGGSTAAALGLGMVAGRLIALRLRPSRPMLACALAFFLAVPGPALLALRAPVIAIAAAQAAAGVAIGFFVAVWQTTLQQHVPEEALSRVSAWDWMGSFAFMPLGFVLAGPLWIDRDLDDTLDRRRLVRALDRGGGPPSPRSGTSAGSMPPSRCRRGRFPTRPWSPVDRSP